MTEYKIYRWDGVMYGNNLIPMPMIYIKPDIPLMDFIKKNNYFIKIIIKGTNKYDNILIDGYVNMTPPNYFNKTGQITVTLVNCGWRGYTGCNKGYCVIIGTKENELKNELKENELKNELKDNEIKNELKDNEIKNELKDNEIKNDIKDNEIKNDIKDNEIKNDIKDNEIKNDSKSYKKLNKIGFFIISVLVLFFILLLVKCMCKK